MKIDRQNQADSPQERNYVDLKFGNLKEKDSPLPPSHWVHS